MAIFADVIFELKFPENVTLNRMPPAVDDVILASVRLRLHNRGLEKVEADMTAGQVHYWEIFDNQNRKIDSIHDMASAVMKHMEILPGGSYPEDAPEERGVLIHGKHFTSEGRYKLTYRYWDAEESVSFNLKINQ